MLFGSEKSSTLPCAVRCLIVASLKLCQRDSWSVVNITILTRVDNSFGICAAALAVLQAISFDREKG